MISYIKNFESINNCGQIQFKRQWKEVLLQLHQTSPRSLLIRKISPLYQQFQVTFFIIRVSNKSLGSTITSLPFDSTSGYRRTVWLEPNTRFNVIRETCYASSKNQVVSIDMPLWQSSPTPQKDHNIMQLFWQSLLLTNCWQYGRSFKYTSKPTENSKSHMCLYALFFIIHWARNRWSLTSLNITSLSIDCCSR